MRHHSSVTWLLGSEKWMVARRLLGGRLRRPGAEYLLMVTTVSGALYGWGLMETVHCGKTVPRELTLAMHFTYTLDQTSCHPQQHRVNSVVTTSFKRKHGLITDYYHYHQTAKSSVST